MPSVNPWFGRETEEREVLALLRRDDVRLVTITGQGGVGNTRLALRAAEEAAQQWFSTTLVDLAGVDRAEFVVPAVAASLGLVGGDGESPDDIVCHALSVGTHLLVLDNLDRADPQ